MKRPNKFDEDVKLEVAKILLPEIKEWMGDVEEEDEDIIDHIYEALDTYDWDGFNLAKGMDAYFNSDSRLVEIMDGAEYKAMKVVKKKTKSWLETNKIQPQYKKGDTVIVSLARHGKQKGEILSVDSNEGRYHFFVEELCVRNGPGINAFIVPWEDVTEHD